MTDATLGLRSEELRAALEDALARRPSRLGDLLARHGGLPGPRPNFALGAALGAALASEGPRARPLLDALRLDPALADAPRAFLPVAAAFGYAARLEHDAAHAWEGLFELSADDRAPVRVAMVRALSDYVARGAGRVDALVARAAAWLEHDDAEHVFASQAVVLDVIADRRGLEGLEDPAALLTWLEQAIDALANAPRSAERSLARRKMLIALPGALAEAVASLRGAHDGPAWLLARAAEVHDPDLFVAMERTIDALSRGTRAQKSELIDALRSALASTVKPPRDPTRVREKARGRGKKAKRRSRGT